MTGALRAATLLAALAPAAPAAALEYESPTARQAAELRFTATTPGTPSGLWFPTEYRDPADPQAKPPSVRRVVFVLADGARFDAGAPQPCMASDAELVVRSAAACPAASHVGPGYVLVDSGFAAPQRFFESDVDLIDGPDDEQIVLNTERTSGARVVLRGRMSRREYRIEFPPLPGSPPDGGAVAGGFVEFRALVRDGRSYVTTPPTCPRSGVWTNLAHFTYSDGVTQTVTTQQRCERPRPRSRARSGRRAGAGAHWRPPGSRRR